MKLLRLRYLRATSRPLKPSVKLRSAPTRCAPKDKEDGATGEPDQALVKDTVKELRRADVDQYKAREIMKFWRDSGVTDEPEELRKLYREQGNASLGRFGVQLVLDACACYAAYQAVRAIDAGGTFFGKEAILFVFSAVTFNYALAFISNFVSMGISLRSMNRFGTNAAAYLEAVKQIAGTSSLDSVNKVQGLIDSFKIARSLEKMDTFLKNMAQEGNSKMETVESLAVYFILNEAKTKFGFKPERYGLSSDDAATIARLFARYDTNDDGRIDTMELRKLCADAGRNLTHEEAKEAMKAIDENGNGILEFNEFVSFWVNPSQAKLKVSNESNGS